jgi:hypothetical protein
LEAKITESADASNVERLAREQDDTKKIIATLERKKGVLLGQLENCETPDTMKMFMDRIKALDAQQTEAKTRLRNLANEASTATIDASKAASTMEARYMSFGGLPVEERKAMLAADVNKIVLVDLLTVRFDIKVTGETKTVNAIYHPEFHGDRNAVYELATAEQLKQLGVSPVHAGVLYKNVESVSRSWAHA